MIVAALPAVLLGRSPAAALSPPGGERRVRGLASCGERGVADVGASRAAVPVGRGAGAPSGAAENGAAPVSGSGAEVYEVRIPSEPERGDDGGAASCCAETCPHAKQAANSTVATAHDRRTERKFERRSMTDLPARPDGI
ncbi:MAG: hypothetical protein C0483_20975 [Pirellula sp.]|nr:hypothetical protein [Pirellula sp.]